MQDRIPVNPGRVLISPENGSAYYATMTRADNPTQEGDPLNKNTLLKDATATLFGLGADAVPDDVFGVLSRFQSGMGNEYVWAKTKLTANAGAGTMYTNHKFTWYTTSYGNYDVYYANSLEDALNQNFVRLSMSSYSSANAYASAVQSLVRGKYFKIEVWPNDQNSFGPLNLCYLPADATVSKDDSDFIIASKIIDYPSATIVVENFGYVNSTNPNAYPVNDGYTYTALGQLGAKVQIATGSYTGTGTYGASNPNSLTFGFVPKLVVIYGNGYLTLFVASAATSTYAEWALVLSSNGAREKVQTRIIETTLNWYVTSGNGAQSNESGRTYAYIAIG